MSHVVQRLSILLPSNASGAILSESNEGVHERRSFLVGGSQWSLDCGNRAENCSGSRTDCKKR